MKIFMEKKNSDILDDLEGNWYLYYVNVFVYCNYLCNYDIADLTWSSVFAENDPNEK